MHFRSLKKTMGDVSLSDVLDTDGEGNNLSLMDVLAQDDEMSEKKSAILSFAAGCADLLTVS